LSTSSSSKSAGEILIWPDDGLKTVCETAKFEEALIIWPKMIEICLSWRLKGFRSVGIAANQIGSNKAVFVMIPKQRMDRLKIVINPKIVRHGKGIIDSKEGCMSVPGKQRVIPRFEIIDVEYLNDQNKIVTETLKRTDAVIFQHEFEHLCGVCGVAGDTQK